MKTLTYQQTIAPPQLVPSFDAPTWMLGHGDHSEISAELEEFQFPDRVIIVGTLTPHYAESSVTGCYQDDSDTLFLSAFLYGENYALSRIEWTANWIEKSDGAVEEMLDPLTWGMDFAVQHKNVVAQYTLPSDERPGFWHATQSTVEPVWSWGGVYSHGCALTTIKTRYFSLLPGGVQTDGAHTCADTKIAWLSSINPHYQKLCGSDGCDATDEETAAAIFQPMSLLNHIQFGSIMYFLPDVADAVGYQSSDVLDYDPQNGRVKLLFLRRNHDNSTTQH